MAIPTDPLLSSQWHLGNVGGLLDLNVIGAWQLGYSGAGTWTVVIDNGFDYNHSDLSPNYYTSLDFDFENDTLDAFGAPTESHGTAVAGIIGADDNGTGAVGVAFDTSIVGYRTANLISDAWLQDIRDAIHHAAVSALGDVANISQGIANDLNSEWGIGYNAVRFDEIETSIGTAVGSGRGGLGMTIVKAAGNSRAGNYDINADDWTNDTRQVVVAAVDQNGFVSSYSSYGAALLVSAFGTPGEVVTTDRVGAAGYDSDDFTETFNGTSAAAPMVSGVVQLMYDANPSLGWRDVQTILAYSARHVGSDIGAGTAGFERYPWQWNAATTWNGGGLHFSNDYGYGLVDATAAVLLAETWLDALPAQTSANEFQNSVDMLNAAVVIPDGNLTGTTFTGIASFDDEVDRVTVQVTFSSTFTADMQLYVTSPDGTVSELINNVGGSADFNGTWTFETQAFRGERAAGTWSVRIVDQFGLDVLSVSDIVVRTFGRFSTNDRYVFTDEYGVYGGVAGHDTVTDTNGGIDEINAAAVSSGNSIDLRAGFLSVIAGQLLTIAAGTEIENAHGGSGNDFIFGNGVGNVLWGMRGDDWLRGDAGGDTLNGSLGSDTASYFGSDAGVNVSLLTGSAAGGHADGDILSSIENLDGSGFDDSLSGDGGVNILTGNDGNDTLTGDAGGDTLIGGLGLDTASYFDSDAGVNVSLLTGFTAGGHAVGDTFSSIENLDGSAYDDSFSGDGGANVLTGNDGNDLLRGRAGGDTLNGGAGLDTASYSDSNAAVNVSLLTGFAAGGHAVGDTFSLIENLEGSAFNDLLSGDGGINVLTGNNGNDLLRGRAGGDTLNGGAGLDTASYSDSDAAVNVSLLTGFAAGGHAVGDTFSSIENLEGSAFNDLLSGDGGVNVLTGNNGNDLLRGRAGGDTLNGGAGLDTASYSDSTAAVNVSLLTGFAAGGHAAGDTFSSIENLDGSGFDDLLSGDGGANVLTGNNGNDLLRGRAGGDTLNGGAGLDTASYSDSDAAVNVSLLTGFAAGGHAAGDTFSSIENLEGSAFNDLLSGDAGVNVLTGNNGNDLLRGRAGGDLLNGGLGSDTASYSDSTAAVNVSLLTGFAAGGHAAGDIFSSIENFIGSAFNDILNGGGDANRLEGGGGGDTLNGGAGLDTASYSDSNAAVNVSLLTGFAAGGHAAGDIFSSIENFIGSSFNDILNGGGNANRLEGASGNDTLRGNGALDFFVFGDLFGLDTVADWINGELFDFSSSTLVDEFADLSITNSGANAIIAYDLGNQITVVGGAGLIDAADFIFA